MTDGSTHSSAQICTRSWSDVPRRRCRPASSSASTIRRAPSPQHALHSLPPAMTRMQRQWRSTPCSAHSSACPPCPSRTAAALPRQVRRKSRPRPTSPRPDAPSPVSSATSAWRAAKVCLLQRPAFVHAARIPHSRRCDGCAPLGQSGAAAQHGALVRGRSAHRRAGCPARRAEWCGYSGRTCPGANPSTASRARGQRSAQDGSRRGARPRRARCADRQPAAGAADNRAVAVSRRAA